MRYENNERTNAIRINGKYPLVIRVGGRSVSKMHKTDKGLVYEDSFIKAVPFSKLVNNTNDILTGLNQNPPRYNNQEMKYPIVASSKLVWQRLPDNFNFKYSINSYQVFHRYRSGMRKAWECNFSDETNSDNTLSYRKTTKENVVYGFRKWRDKIYTDTSNTNYHKTHFNSIILNPDFQNTKRLRLLNFPYRIEYPAGTDNEIYPFILKGFVTRESDNYSDRKHILYSLDMHYAVDGIFNNTYSNESPYQIQYSLKLSTEPMNDEEIEGTGTWIPMFTEKNVRRSDNPMIMQYSHNRYASTRISSGTRTDIASNLRPSITTLKNYMNIYDYFISTYGSVRYVELGENVLKTKTIGSNSNQFKLPDNSELIDVIDRNNYLYGAIKLEISNQYGRAAYYFKMDIDKDSVVRWAREDTGIIHSQADSSRPGGNIIERIITLETMDTAEYKYVNNVKTNITRNPSSREIRRSVAEWKNEWVEKRVTSVDFISSGDNDDNYDVYYYDKYGEVEYVDGYKSGNIRNERIVSAVDTGLSKTSIEARYISRGLIDRGLRPIGNNN